MGVLTNELVPFRYFSCINETTQGRDIKPVDISRTNSIHVRKGTIRDRQLVVEILVSAFLPLTEDNSINYVIKQDVKRSERMKILMDYLFEKALRSGEIFISKNNKACILLHYPHQKKFTFKSLMLLFRLVFKCIGIERVPAVVKRQLLARKYYPKEKHIIPLIMGVKKEHGGEGTGARLIIDVLNKSRTNNLPVIVNAASERNARLYERFGFIRIGKEESLGFPIYFLRLN